jgi:hypothetical protein
MQNEIITELTEAELELIAGAGDPVFYEDGHTYDRADIGQI